MKVQQMSRVVRVFIAMMYCATLTDAQTNGQPSLKFGAKIVPKVKQEASLEATNPRPPIMQYKIPIVHKEPAHSAQDQAVGGLNTSVVQKPTRNPNRSRVYVQPILRGGSGGISRETGISRGISRDRLRKSSITTTTTTSTTSTTTAPPYPIQITYTPPRNPFDFLQQAFWNFTLPFTQQLTTTRKPPKKYIQSPVEEHKLHQQKAKVGTKLIKPTEPPKQHALDGPFRIALPTLNVFNQQQDSEREKEKRATLATLRQRFNCPRENEVRFQLFPKICKIDKDCSVWNRDELCCDIFGAKSCVSGLPKPLEEAKHAPILGLIPRKCPTRPLAELWWEVKECDNDMDCWPRVCCPDGRRRYCRTSQPELETAPVQVQRSFNYLTEYLECTPPPPPIFDLHPKACISTLDCFPNVCCQEAGLRHCRPPKKSVLTWMANFLNVDFVKRLTQNLVIK